MAVHTIGPFTRTHEILRARRAAILKAAEDSVQYPQGESALTVLLERHVDAAVRYSAFETPSAAGFACLVKESAVPIVTFGARNARLQWGDRRPELQGDFDDLRESTGARLPWQPYAGRWADCSVIEVNL